MSSDSRNQPGAQGTSLGNIVFAQALEGKFSGIKCADNLCIKGTTAKLPHLAGVRYLAKWLQKPMSLNPSNGFGAKAMLKEPFMIFMPRVSVSFKQSLR